MLARQTLVCTLLIAASVLVAVLCSLPHAAHAIDESGFISTYGSGFVPLAQTESGPLANLYKTSANGDLSNFINALFKFALVVGAIGAVLRLAYAGYLYMGQADMWSHKGEAKAIIGDVTLGVLLLLGVYLILKQINPDILNLNGLQRIQSTPVQQAPAQPSNVQQFSTPPAPNSYFGGADGYDPNLNGCGVNGCDTFNPNPVSP